MPTRTSTSHTSASISNILFSVRTADIEICPGQKINSSAPSATPKSPKRPSTSTTSPRYSRLAAELKRFFDKKVNALWSKDANRVYCEFTANDGTLVPILYDEASNTAYTTRDNDGDLCIPMLLLAMHPDKSTFSYTRSAVESMVASMNKTAKTVGAVDLGYVCETFYYDWNGALSTMGGSINIAELDDPMMQSVQQNIRTGQMEPISTCFDEFLSGSFALVTYTPPARTSSRGTVGGDLDSFFTNAKAGECLLGYEWSEEQMEKIRPLESLDDYIPNEIYLKMAKIISKKLNRVIERTFTGKSGVDAIKSDYVNIILCGRPGTGKTTTADALSATLGLPIYTTKVSKNTEEDTFEGMTKANSEGKFLLHDTAFLKAYQNGGIIVLEEFNLADPGILQGAIGQAIEYPFILNRDGYQEIRRHPMCVIVSTMNTGTQGAREPNQAFSSRHPVTLIMDDPSENDFISILAKKGHPKTLCKKVYKAYTSILDYIKNVANDEEMALAITMRHCIAALELYEDDIDPTLRDAVYDTMIGAIAIRDMDLAQEAFKSAVMPLPLT